MPGTSGPMHAESSTQPHDPSVSLIICALLCIDSGENFFGGEHDITDANAPAGGARHSESDGVAIAVR